MPLWSLVLRLKFESLEASSMGIDKKRELPQFDSDGIASPEDFQVTGECVAQF